MRGRSLPITRVHSVARTSALILTATGINVALLREVLGLASLCCLHNTRIYFLPF